MCCYNCLTTFHPLSLLIRPVSQLFGPWSSHRFNSGPISEMPIGLICIHSLYPEKSCCLSQLPGGRWRGPPSRSQAQDTSMELLIVGGNWNTCVRKTCKGTCRKALTTHTTIVIYNVTFSLKKKGYILSLQANIRDA